MLKGQFWFDFGFEYEMRQALEEGRDAEACKSRFAEILAMNDENPEKVRQAGEIFDEIQKLPVRSGYEYVEPSGLDEIRAARPLPVQGLTKEQLSDERAYDKIYGAWLGRCIGNLLGQPLEGWMRERITGLFRDTGNYPVRYFISSDIPAGLRDKYGVSDTAAGGNRKIVSWINNVKYMPEDDDINYTIIALKLLEDHGKNFTPDDVGECWLNNLPIFHTYTAERAAYRNLTAGIYTPESAKYRNPFREWIGAQIRADFFGYITPDNPELGAEYAWRDASISHTRNGIYGEMFIAAMLSAAASNNDIEKLIEAGLSQIPEKSRLAEKIMLVLSWKREGIGWEAAIDRIHKMFDETSKHDWCHTISNAMIVCMALLYGECDFEKSIGIAVLSAFDTDCNGATVGSILGMILGARALPEKWVKPLNDKVKSGVDGFGLINISELAARTLKISKG